MRAEPGLEREQVGGEDLGVAVHGEAGRAQEATRACTPSSVLSTHSGEVKISALPSEAKPAGPKRPLGACALSSVAEALRDLRKRSRSHG